MAVQTSGACIGANGKPRKVYFDRLTADRGADHVLVLHKARVVPYLCGACNCWHLTPAERHTPSHECRYCPKQSYESESSAERRAALRHREGGTSLRVYECPHGDGWHLTSKR